jgi:hypothetical protein
MVSRWKQAKPGPLHDPAMAAEMLAALDAPQRRPVRGARPTAFRLLSLGWQKRLDHRPEVVGSASVQIRPTPSSRFCPAL